MLLFLTQRSSFREVISNARNKKCNFFVTLKMVAYVLTDDILDVPSESNEQINIKKYEDSNGIVTYDKFELAA